MTSRQQKARDIARAFHLNRVTSAAESFTDSSNNTPRLTRRADISTPDRSDNA